MLTALMMTALCGVAALAMDIGVLFGAKNSAQNAADAAALAGAFTFLNPAAAQPAAAQQAAIALAGANLIWGQPATITAGDVTVDTTNRRVTVDVPRTGANGIPSFFAAVYGVLHFDVIATATAEAAPYASASIALRPIFVPNTILSAETPTSACTDNQVLLDANGNLTPWAATMIGTQMTIRPTSPGGALAPGQFYSLDLSGGSGGGAATYSCALSAMQLSDCNVGPLAACGSSYPTENGDMVGPTQQGINALLGSSPDVWLGPGAYLHPDGTVTDTSSQLITTAVWNDCSPTGAIGPGGGLVTVIGFTNWFVDGMSGTGVQAQFVNAAGCAGAGGVGTGSDSPEGIPVRLVTP